MDKRMQNQVTPNKFTIYFKNLKEGVPLHDMLECIKRKMTEKRAPWRTSSFMERPTEKAVEIRTNASTFDMELLLKEIFNPKSTVVFFRHLKRPPRAHKPEVRKIDISFI